MLFVVASIGSDGLLGKETLQSCLPLQIYEQAAMGRRSIDIAVTSAEVDL